MPHSSTSTMTWSGRSDGRGRSWKAIVRSAVSTTAGIVMMMTPATTSGQRVRPEPAPCNENSQRQQHGIDPDVHGLVAAGVNHCRADHHEDQADRSQRDKDRGDMCDCGEDKPSRAEN